MAEENTRHRVCEMGCVPPGGWGLMRSFITGSEWGVDLRSHCGLHPLT
jgi:hypothetical protein